MTDNTEHEVAFNISSLSKHFFFFFFSKHFLRNINHSSWNCGRHQNYKGEVPAFKRQFLQNIKIRKPQIQECTHNE